MASPNFTPIREPQLTFDTLVLKDGKSIPIQTVVSPGADTVVRFTAGPAEQKKGKIASATEMARQQIEAKKREVIAAIKGPGKMDRVKEFLWGYAPWRPQFPSASRFNAKLEDPAAADEFRCFSEMRTGGAKDCRSARMSRFDGLIRESIFAIRDLLDHVNL